MKIKVESLLEMLLVLEEYPIQSLRFNIFWVHTINWGHIPCERSAIYPNTCRDTFKDAVQILKVINKAKTKKNDTSIFPINWLANFLDLFQHWL